MKSTDRLILSIYIVILTCLLGIFLVIPTGYISYEYGTAVLNGMFRSYRWYYFVLALLLIALNIKLLVDLILGENVKRMGVIKYTSEGEVNISFETIKALTMKTAMQIRGIKDIKVMIKPGKSNINILIKMLIMPDMNIPQTVREVQENVKSYVEAMTEIPVGEIKVVVSNIASNTKLRLE